jgi:hypothetical protein
MTHAADIVRNMADRPHPSTHRAYLAQLRQCFPCHDEGTQETFILDDGSRVRFDHTANHPHGWSVVG